jgi:hypothetical protein
MLPTTSEISWTRSGLAYFIALRKRSNAHAYEHVRAALKWNQARYTWPNRRFQWKYFIVNTWRPTVLYRDCGQWLRNLNLRKGSSRALLIGPQDFKCWKLQLSSFVRRRNPQLWYLFLESAARKIVACPPPSLLPSRLARLKRTSCPICRSIACPCSDQQSWALYPVIKDAISTVVSVTRLVMQVFVANIHHSGS